MGYGRGLWGWSVKCLCGGQLPVNNALKHCVIYLADSLRHRFLYRRLDREISNEQKNGRLENRIVKPAPMQDDELLEEVLSLV
jgi:hypothetical protein